MHFTHSVFPGKILFLMKSPRCFNTSSFSSFVQILCGFLFLRAPTGPCYQTQRSKKHNCWRHTKVFLQRGYKIIECTSNQKLLTFNQVVINSVLHTLDMTRKCNQNRRLLSNLARWGQRSEAWHLHKKWKKVQYKHSNACQRTNVLFSCSLCSLLWLFSHSCWKKWDESSNISRIPETWWLSINKTPEQN